MLQLKSFLIKLQLKKKLWHKCFPVIIPKFLRTSVAASGKIRTRSLKISNISVPYYTSYHGLPLHRDIIVVKRDIHWKILVVLSIHVAIQTSKHLNKKETVSSDMYSTVDIFLHSQRRWRFEIVF